MTRIKCVIVDDEIVAAKGIEKFVLKIPQLELVKIFTNSDEALVFLKTSEVYLVFLDINMDGINGFEMASILKDKKIIFITGNEKFGMVAWNLDNVIGYLLKPIFFEDISKMVKRVSNYFIGEDISAHILSDDFLVFKSGEEIIRIEYDKIVYIEAIGNYTNIYLESKKEFAPISIWDIEGNLPKGKFVRVSKSIIANNSKILDDESKKEIIMIGGFKIKVGKAYKQLSK